LYHYHHKYQVMRLKVLMLGDDPVSLVADGQMLQERGVMVVSAFNLPNITETINEVKPDLVFFNPRHANNLINECYNSLVNDPSFSNLPIVFTLSEDDVYLVTRKRTTSREKKNLMADSMIDALKMALRSYKTYHKKTHNHQQLPPLSSVSARA